VQRAYWDLVFGASKLQVKKMPCAIRAASLNNKRLVAEGALAPIDVVAAEAQVAGFEQSLFSSLEEVSRSEKQSEKSDCVNRQADLWNLSIIPTIPWTSSRRISLYRKL